MMKSNILLVGGGGHCHSVIDVIELENKYNIIGIIDKKELIGKEVFGYRIIGCDDDLEKLLKECKYAVVTVGQIKSNGVRVKLFDNLKKLGYKLPVIVSPLAYISKHAYVGEGTVIMHQSLINSNVHIGVNCIINTKALVEHDSVIENHCHISTASVINGNVLIKYGSFIGSNSVIKESVIIEKKSFIKAGILFKGIYE